MEIRIPSVGESVVQAMVSKWHKKDGEAVAQDDLLCEIETDKITIEVNAEIDGILSIKVQEGETVDIGSAIGAIEEGKSESAGKKNDKRKETGKERTFVEKAEAQELKKAEKEDPVLKKEEGTGGEMPHSPAARKLAEEKGIHMDAVRGTGKGGRIMVDDLWKNMEKDKKPDGRESSKSDERLPHNSNKPVTRKPMTPIRRRIAEHLLAARQRTAMLTTFNEADMGRIAELRSRHKESFQKKHGISLGLIPFFVKACVEALKEFPQINAFIEGEDIVYHHYYDIGIAIGAEKGLVAPVLRDADRLSFAGIDQAIKAFVEKIKTNRLELSDLQGGTFTITNGGVYGSLLSTPILNPPQSGVLGMHTIQDRPVARDGKIIIRPMMYLAFTYDHQIIDGREAVGFLRRIKEYVEEPEELFLEG
jgi:2-oxoglutarate dehydrogenase E2 component (dihydrolipoamide succinyltransferase)